jgi:hypothetical protein
VEFGVLRIEGQGFLEEVSHLASRPLTIHPVEDPRFKHHGLGMAWFDSQNEVKARD